MIWSKLFLLFVGYNLVIMVKAMEYESSRVMGGYPVGLMSDCPGSNKETKINRYNLIYLSFVHLEKGNFIIAQRADYNYFQMNRLAPKLDFKKKTLLYMNGYLDSARHLYFSSIMGSIYTRFGYNVLLLEYQWFSAMIYPQAARSVRAVGRHTAEMLATLTAHGLNPKKLEILGISLGGQGISFIGKHYQKITGKNISRITALDPAGPCFRHLGPEDRLSPSDADFVEVIHTNIDGYGIAIPSGHVDYYINGGEFQIADITEFPCSSFCSHLKSYTLWVAAKLFPDNFIAIKCDTIQDARDRNCYERTPLETNLLGPKADKNKTGIYYLATNPYYPFYLRENGTKRVYDPYLKYMPALNTDSVMVL